MGLVTLNGSENVIIEGRFTPRTKKFGYNMQQTITGKRRKQYVDKEIIGNLIIEECTKTEFEQIETMWLADEEIEIIDQFGNRYHLTFTDEELNLEVFDEIDDVELFSGNVMFGG